MNNQQTTKLMELQKLKVAADPRYVGGHPYHQARFIVTEGADLEHDVSNQDVPTQCDQCGSKDLKKLPYGDIPPVTKARTCCRCGAHVYAETTVSLADNHGSIIAELTDCEHQARYAKVMAAGPELLDALQLFVKQYEGNGHDEQREDRPEMIAARAAIAKATK